MQEQPTSLSFNPSVSDRKNMQPQGSPTEDGPPKAIPQLSAPRGVLSTMPNNLSPPSRKRQNSFFPRDDDRHLPQDLPRNPGGADRDRTGDLKLAKLALSQLSYGPLSVTGTSVTGDQNRKTSTSAYPVTGHRSPVTDGGPGKT